MPRNQILSGNTKLVTVLASLIIVAASLGISQVIGTNEKTALYLVSGIAIFLFAFVSTDFALSVLVLSMLLSPEFALGSSGGVGQVAQRNVVLRIDDLLLGVISLSWLVKTSINKELGIFIKTPMNKPIFAYIITSIFATVLGIFMGNVKPLVGILYNVKYFQYFMIYFMVSSHVKDMKTFKRYMWLIMITALTVTIYASIQIPSGVRVSAPFEGEAGEANTLGGYLIIIMFIVIGMMTGVKKSSHLGWLAAFLGFMMLPFAFTLSRSSWISFGPAIIAMILLSPMRKAVIGVTLVAILVSPVFIPRAVYERIEYTFSDENTLRSDVVDFGETSLDPSTSQRIQSWTFTIQQWSERPILGWGVTGAGFKDAQYFRVLAETGVMGLSLFIWLLISIHRFLKSRLKSISRERSPIYHGMLVGFIAAYWGLLTHAVGANTFIIVRVMEPFWFLMGLFAVLPDILKDYEAEEDVKKLEKFYKQDMGLMSNRY